MNTDKSTDLVIYPYDRSKDPEFGKETWKLIREVVKTKGQIKKVIMIAAIIILMAFSALLVVHIYGDYQEYSYYDSLKPVWHTIIQYKGNAGRYPKDLQEYADYYKNGDDAGTLPFIYVLPRDGEKDEILLRWKKKTIQGFTIGITESGKPVKEE